MLRISSHDQVTEAQPASKQTLLIVNQASPLNASAGLLALPAA
jgi:hypothetical protein